MVFSFRDADRALSVGCASAMRRVKQLEKTAPEARNGGRASPRAAAKSKDRAGGAAKTKMKGNG